MKKWIPELINLPKKFLHRPWEFKDNKLFKIGSDYPKPIVVHEKARELALKAFKQI